MKIVIAAPLYPPEIGGPAAYAKELREYFAAAGHEVSLVRFAEVRRYPSGVRHLAYLGRVWRAARGADAVLGFDTWSTGIPAMIAARLRGAKMVVRIGGDFLWETYVGRSHDPVKLSAFYTAAKQLSLKERLIFAGTRWLTRHADALVFNTAWQKRLWERAYGFSVEKASVIENEYPTERVSTPATGRVFVAVGREHFLKNTEMLAEAFTQVKRAYPDIELDTRPLPPAEHEARIRDAYAVVVPSISEVSSNTALDALRAGKPCIMTADTGARERLSDACLFVDMAHPGALREAIEALLDPARYERACAQVRAFSFTHSWDEVANEFLAVITDVCAS